MKWNDPNPRRSFDAALTRIHEVADKTCARSGRQSYACILAAEDF